MNALQFEPLKRLPWIVHGFTLRPFAGRPDPDAGTSKLTLQHQKVLDGFGLERGTLALAEQLHGAEIAAVRHGRSVAPGADGLLTIWAGVVLGIHVADCCAIYLVETRQHAIALLHSGRRGTEANIAGAGVRKLLETCGGTARDLVAVLSPCIHKCCYDVDFVAEIERQLGESGVGSVWRHADCTACHPNRYDSYRRDKGTTGRMLAFLALRDR